MHKVAGVVLCGGRSSRMGRDKAYLRYRGVPLFDHMRGLLRRAGLENIFLSGQDGIPDLLPGLGPLGGLHACVRALADRYTHALFVPVDMPLLTPARVSTLIVRGNDADAIHYAGQPFPLKLALSASTQRLLDALTGETAGHRRSIKTFIAALTVDCLPVADRDAAMFTNINSLRDWRSLFMNTSRHNGHNDEIS